MANNPFSNINFTGNNTTLPTLPGSPTVYNGGATPAGQPGLDSSGGSGIQGILNFLSTPGGAAVTNFAGAGLQAYGQAKEAAANRQQSATQFAATSLQNQYNQDQANKITRASGVLNADPLGADQKYAQRNALMAAILPNLRNTRSAPGDAAVAGAMGGSRGGFMNALPANGLDPAMIDSMFGNASTAQSIAQRHQEISSLDPNAPIPNLTPMYGQDAAAPMAQMQQWASQLQSASAADRAKYDQAMQGYINQMVQQENAQNNSGGFWHKFAQIAGVVGAAAATIMTAGGASPLLAGAVGAASGAVGSAGSGQNPLMGAIVGGGTAYAGAKARGNS